MLVWLGTCVMNEIRSYWFICMREDVVRLEILFCFFWTERAESHQDSLFFHVKRLEQREFRVLRISILISTPIVVCHILINLDKALQDSFFFHVKRLEQREFVFLWTSFLVSLLSFLIQILINFLSSWPSTFLASYQNILVDSSACNLNFVRYRISAWSVIQLKDSRLWVQLFYLAST